MWYTIIRNEKGGVKMRRITLKEFLSMWNVTNEKVFLTKTEPVRMLDELGDHFLVRARFENLLRMLPRAYADIDSETAVLFLDTEEDGMIKLKCDEWRKNRKRYIYFEIEHRWTPDFMDADWYVVGKLKLTKPRVTPSGLEKR